MGVKWEPDRITGTVATQPSSTLMLRWLQLRAIAHSVSSPRVTKVIHGA